MPGRLWAVISGSVIPAVPVGLPSNYLGRCDHLVAVTVTTGSLCLPAKTSAPRGQTSGTACRFRAIPAIAGLNRYLTKSLCYQPADHPYQNGPCRSDLCTVRRPTRDARIQRRDLALLAGIGVDAVPVQVGRSARSFVLIWVGETCASPDHDRQAVGGYPVHRVQAGRLEQHPVARLFRRSNGAGSTRSIASQ